MPTQPKNGQKSDQKQQQPEEKKQQQQRQEQSESDVKWGGANKRPEGRSEDIDEEEDAISSFDEKKNQPNQQNQQNRNRNQPTENQNQSRI